MQRSCEALMAASVRLVGERGTTAVTVTDVAEAADVSRQLVYLQFGDRDTLFVEAAVDLLERELLPRFEDAVEDHRRRLLTMAEHFARHRSFYRAMLTGSCAFAMTRALNGWFGSLNARGVRQSVGGLDPTTTDDLAAFLTGGTGAVVNGWLIDGADPLDPQELVERLLRVGSVLTGVLSARAEGGHPR